LSLFCLNLFLLEPFKSNPAGSLGSLLDLIL
jgi:hypothetical protein